MEEKAQIIHNFDGSEDKKQESNININMQKSPVILFVVLALLGVATGFVVSRVSGVGTVQVAGPGGKITTTSVSKGQVFGSADAKTFKDSAEGILKIGGVNGEGAYHLVRPGGDSQNVYLTSSVIDLSGFVGKKVKVWGQTNTAQTAGWLMDVGRLQVL